MHFQKFIPENRLKETYQKANKTKTKKRQSTNNEFETVKKQL